MRRSAFQQLTSVPLAVIACALTTSAAAQDPPRSEVRTFAGAFIPTGAQAHDFSTGLILGGTLATATGSRTRTIASLAWSPTVNTFAGFEPRVQVISWDIGVETATAPFRSAARVVPFGGLGFGARTYEYATDSLNNPNFVAGYVAAGVEVRSLRPKLRVELRNYVSAFRRPDGGRGSVRTDFVVNVGMAYEIRDW